jgi:hypothetical protein
MTVLDNTPRDQYTATSGQTVFPYTFEIAAAGDIKVLQNGTLIDQGAGAGEYAVSGVGVDTGGNVTLVTGATTGDVLTIYRDMALERLTAYTNAGDFLAADVNNDYDRLWLALQQNTGVSNRALVAPNTDPTSIDMTIPDKATRLNKMLRFNVTTGNPEVVDAADIVGSGAFNVYNFNGDGAAVAFTLGTSPGVENNTQVYIDGVYQQKNTYTVSSTTLTFSAAPPNLSTIEVMVVTAQPINTANAASVSFTQAGSTYGRNVQLKLQETVSVKDFGAIGDGTTDDTVTIQAALNSGAKKILIPTGTYKCTAKITLPTNVSLVGETKSSSVLDFSSATGINECLSTATGTFTALPALGANISIGDSTITFDSAPSLSVGDVFIVSNPTPSSWSTWRTYYKAGEYFRVSQISGSVVTIEGTAADNYLIAAVNLYTLVDWTTCELKDFTLKGTLDSTNVDGLTLRSGIDCLVENVKATNCSHSAIVLDSCYNSSVINCTAKDEGSIDLAGDYGITLGACHICQVQGGEFVSARHGVTIGNGSLAHSPIGRYITVNGAYIATIGGNIQAADIHGNAEYVTYSNCVMDGGITPGGDHFTLIGNTLRSSVANGSVLIYVAELKGTNFIISDNIFLNNRAPNATRGYFIDCGGNGDVFSRATRGGTMKISGNTFQSEYVGDIDQGIYIHEVTAAWTGSGNRDISITGNSARVKDYTNTNRYRLLVFSLIRVAEGLTKFNKIIISDNSVNGAVKVYADGAGSSTGYAADSLLMSGNHLLEGSLVTIQGVNRTSVTGNLFERMQYGASFSGQSVTYKNDFVSLSGNQFVDCPWAHTGSSSTSVNYFMSANALCLANDLFSSSKMMYVRMAPVPAGAAANFQVGETITGASGATAVVQEIQDPFLFVRDTIAGGPFQTSEIVIGGTSGASETTDATTAQGVPGSYNGSFFNNIQVFRDHNVDHNIAASGIASSSRTNYSSGNTTDTTTI